MSDTRVHASQIEAEPVPAIGLTGTRLDQQLAQAAQLGGSGQGIPVSGDSYSPVVAYTLHFTGAGVSLSDDGSNNVTINIPGGGGGGGGDIDIYDEGSLVLTAATALNFVGSGVLAEDIGGGVVRVTIDFPTPDVDADQVNVDNTGLSQALPDAQQWIEHLDGRAVRYSTYTFEPPDTTTTQIIVPDPFAAVLSLNVGGVPQPVTAYDVDVGTKTITFAQALPSLPVTYTTVAEEQI